MRIAETYEVTLGGDRLRSVDLPEKMTYWVVDDNGVRQQVSIPTMGNLHKKFEWMSETNCLRHLKDLEPDFSTNEEEIEAVRKHNAWVQENQYSLNGNTHFYDKTTGQTHYVGYKQIPPATWKATWTFWSKEAAVMFKLAEGGK